MSLTNLTHLFRIWGAELLSEIAAVQLRSEGLFPKFDGNWFLLIGFEGLPWWWWWCNQIHINPQNLYLCICIFMYLYIDVFVYWCIYILMCLYIDVFVFVYSCWSKLPLPEIHFNPWNTFYIYSLLSRLLYWNWVADWVLLTIYIDSANSHFMLNKPLKKTQADISFTNPLAVGSGLKGTPSKSRGHLGISGQNPNLPDTGNISKLLKSQFWASVEWGIILIPLKHFKAGI